MNDAQKSSADASASPWREIARAMKLAPYWGVIGLVIWYFAPDLVRVAFYFAGPQTPVPEGESFLNYVGLDWWQWWDESLRLGIAVAGVLIARFVCKQPMMCVGLGAPRLKQDAGFLVKMLLISGGAFVVLAGVLYLVALGSPESVGAQEGESLLDFLRRIVLLSDLSWEQAIFMLVYAPIIEELVFRGWLYTQIRTVMRSALLPIVATALLFAFMHGSMPISQLIGGVVFAWAYERTRQLYVPIMLHVAGNGSLFLIAYALAHWL